MADLTETKKKAINFLLESIDKSWALKPDDNDPLRFEAYLYLAHRGKISKSEWGEKIKKIWDTWIEYRALSPPSELLEGAKSRKRDGWFWPSIDGYCIDIGDPDNADWETGFSIENHLAMFRTREVFLLPGYTEDFVRAKKELGKILRSHGRSYFHEEERLLWQIVRSPFLRMNLKDSLRGVAQGIIEEKMAIIKNEPMVVNESLCRIRPADIFFLLATNLDDDHISLSKFFLNKEIHSQSKNGSFSDDEFETCLYLCSICLSGIDPNRIVSNPAIAWLMNVQQENGSWKYGCVHVEIPGFLSDFAGKEVFNNIKYEKITEEDIFLTVFVLETLDLITNDKPLPIWAKNVAPTQPSLKGGQTIGHLLTVPDGIKWGDVSITFISEEAVEIRAGVPLGVKNFIELGFKDNRGANRPDQKWELLKSLGRNCGSISWKDKSASSKYKPYFKTIRKRLRALFKIDDDPFFSYRQTGSYKTKFSIAFREEN